MIDILLALVAGTEGTRTERGDRNVTEIVCPLMPADLKSAHEQLLSEEMRLDDLAYNDRDPRWDILSLTVHGPLPFMERELRVIAYRDDKSCQAVIFEKFL